jgi:Preprotein translocase subunit SecA (ATPase, RNA helicase)
MDPRERVLRGLHYAVLDEVDSILIDEARTPLIISGPGEVLDQNYLMADRFVKGLKNDTDFTIDAEDRSASLTEKGIQKAEKAFKIENIYNGKNAELVHYIQNALRANYIMAQADILKISDNEILWFTGKRNFEEGVQALQETYPNLKLITLSIGAKGSRAYANGFHDIERLWRFFCH